MAKYRFNKALRTENLRLRKFSPQGMMTKVVI
jgi:hypothetical protein